MHGTHQRRRCPRAAWRSPRAAREPLSWPVHQPQRSRQVRMQGPCQGLGTLTASRTGLVVTALWSVTDSWFLLVFIDGRAPFLLHCIILVHVSNVASLCAACHETTPFPHYTSNADTPAYTCAPIPRIQHERGVARFWEASYKVAKAGKSLIPSTESACGRPRSAHRMRNRHR